jgi:hypothetical protein
MALEELVGPVERGGAPVVGRHPPEAVLPLGLGVAGALRMDVAALRNGRQLGHAAVVEVDDRDDLQGTRGAEVVSEPLEDLDRLLGLREHA